MPAQATHQRPELIELNRSLVLVAITGFFAVMSGVASAEENKDPAAALEIFEQRIMPIFRSPKPSSCVQCHLSSVDLKHYILPSSEKTFLSLRDQGLISTKKPLESKILKLIRMGDRDPDLRSKRIHEKNRKAELDAFTAWVEACCADDKLVNLPKLSGSNLAKPAVHDHVIRFTRKSRVVDSFVRNIWSQRMRCFPCHTSNEIDPNNPRHKVPAKRHKEFIAQYGQRMNIFKKTPEQTLQHLIVSSQRSHKNALPLINLKNPEHSLLLLKPTAKVPPPKEGVALTRGVKRQFEPPSSVLPVSHMGGIKIHKNDQAYKSFLNWLTDYANVVHGKYKSVEDLPNDNWFPTQHIVMLNKTPESWASFTPVQIFLHKRTSDGRNWNDEPIAFTQGLVTPRHRVNGALVLLAPSSHPQSQFNAEAALPKKGNFLMKVYVDRRGIIAKNPGAMLTSKDLALERVLEINDWKPGFKNRQMVHLK